MAFARDRCGAKCRLRVLPGYIGQPQDEYYPSVTYVMRDLGLASFSVGGNYAFKFTVNSKNSSSSGYTLAFDYIDLIPE
jgi:hypothetical protein